jgi:hypothetical protein
VGMRRFLFLFLRKASVCPSSFGRGPVGCAEPVVGPGSRVRFGLKERDGLGTTLTGLAFVGSPCSFFSNSGAHVPAKEKKRHVVLLHFKLSAANSPANAYHWMDYKQGKLQANDTRYGTS